MAARCDVSPTLSIVWSAQLDAQPLGLPRLHGWTEAFRVYAINVYKNDLPFKPILARDNPHGSLTASSNEKYVLFFSVVKVSDIIH